MIYKVITLIILLIVWIKIRLRKWEKKVEKFEKVLDRWERIHYDE